MKLSFEELSKAVRSAAAFVAVTELSPAGGPQDRIHPPTFPAHPSRKGPYLVERHLDANGVAREAVVLDTVGSQANWLETALAQGIQEHGLTLPCPVVDYSGVPDKGVSLLREISALEFSHRIADGNLRFGLVQEGKEKVPFFRSSISKHLFKSAKLGDHSPLFGECPHSLLFGFWDSGGAWGAAGPKVARNISSEIIGWDAQEGVLGGIRRDPSGIEDVGELIEDKEGDGFIVPKVRTGKRKENDKETKHASSYLLGNTPFPVKTDTHPKGGFTISSATQTFVLNLVGLRSLRFKSNASGQTLTGKDQATAEWAARTLLAAMGLLSLALGFQRGYNLRSRCLLIPKSDLSLTLRSAGHEESFTLPLELAIASYRQAVEEVKAAGLPWNEQGLRMTPTKAMIELIQRSQEELAKATAKDEQPEDDAEETETTEETPAKKTRKPKKG